MEKIYKDSEERFVRNVKTYVGTVGKGGMMNMYLSFTPELTKESAVTISQAFEMFEAGQLLVYIDSDYSFSIVRPVGVNKSKDNDPSFIVIAPGNVEGSIRLLSDDKHEWDELVNPPPKA